MSYENSNQQLTSSVNVEGLVGWRITRLKSADDLALSLPPGTREDGFWLKPAVLAFLMQEDQGFKTEALLIEHKESGVQIACTLQISQFRAAGNVRDEAKGATSRFDFRRSMLAPFSFKIAVLGQYLTSGPYPMDGLVNLEEKQRTELWEAVADTLLEEPDGFKAILVKDLFRAEGATSQHLQASGYYALPVDPVMELAIPAEWTSVEEYLSSLTSKYRVRYRRARGKFTGLSKRPLSWQEVEERSAEIFALYKSTSSGADYNATDLSPAYFPWLAKTQAHDTSSTGFTGYFEGEKLIGFTTTIGNGPVLHAHYLGMLDTYKFSHHLYHNMLFDLLEGAIAGGYRKLDYGRTALEIKSSVGAVATQYACLIKAKSGLLNRLIPVFTPAVYGKQPWQSRSPFKN